MKTIEVTISGLEEWNDGIVSGTTLTLTILCDGKNIICDTLNGKSTATFTRKYDVDDIEGDLTWYHNRPDLPTLKVSAKFSEQK